MDVVLAQPRGFCAGVARAIEIVERALDRFGAPVYVYHEIVHNGHVVDDLAGRGAVFVDDVASIPFGAVTVFSAHGVSTAVVEAARARGLRVVDATCPLVTKVHLQAQRYAKRGHTIVVVGHAGHEEVEGTTGSIDGPVHVVGTLEDVAQLPMPRDAPVAYVTQTTLSVDDTREIIEALEARYPGIAGPGLDDICYATLNRQRATRTMARQVDLVLVVGARNSSNSNRLREVALQQGVPSYLVQTAADIDPAWLGGVGRVGVTAGASAPEVLVQNVCERLRDLGAASVRELPGLAETVKFRLPDLLQATAQQHA
jgi:4-hydroxy-3-methylbut-2-enyl diphosphate reductase